MELSWPPACPTGDLVCSLDLFNGELPPERFGRGPRWGGGGGRCDGAADVRTLSYFPQAVEAVVSLLTDV